MAGGTHVFDMIKRLRNNDSLRKKNYFKTRHAYTRISNSIDIDYRTASESEKKGIRRRLLEERGIEKRKMLLAGVLSIVCPGILIIFFWKYVKI